MSEEKAVRDLRLEKLARMRELGCDEKTRECLIEAWSRQAAADDALGGAIHTSDEAAGFWKRKRG